MSTVGLSTKLFDLDGFLLFRNNLLNQGALDISRRVSSSATLDGGSFVSDNGYSDSDRTFTINVVGLTESEIGNIARLVKLHSRFFLCHREGAFEVIVKSANYARGVLRLSLLTVGAA